MPRSQRRSPHRDHRRLRQILALTWSAALLLSLTACGATDTAERVDALRERYAALTDYTAETDVTLCRETENVTYTLRVEADAATTRVTVLAPAPLAGTSAQLTGDTLALEFDGLLFDTLSAAESLSAVNCVPLTLHAVGNGTLLAQNEERLGEHDHTLRLEFESEAGGETLRCTVYFDDADAPLYAEVAENEKIAAFMEFTSFTFCDKIAPDETTAAG